jgi:phosphoheptose isomerase
MTWNEAAQAYLNEIEVRHPALSSLSSVIEAAAHLLCNVYRSGGKVLLCGNGGSAADCDHIVGELVKGFALPRPLPAQDVAKLEADAGVEGRALAAKLQSGIPAISLSGHPALSTAILNDTDAHIAFAQQVYVYGRPGDALLALSTSGNSRNVLSALRVANAFGLHTVGFTGGNPAQMDELCETLIKVPATTTFKIQEYHLPLYHTLCLVVEAQLFAEPRESL